MGIKLRSSNRLYPFTNFSKDNVSSTEISEDSVSAESTEDNVSAPELVEEDQKLFDDIYYSCHAKKSSACSRTNEEATVLHIIDVMEAPLLFQILSFFSFCGLHLILAHSALQSCFVMGSKLLLLRAGFDIAFACEAIVSKVSIACICEITFRFLQDHVQHHTYVACLLLLARRGWIQTAPLA